MKNTVKKRNPIVLAMMNKKGAGSHRKTHKQLRNKWKRDHGTELHDSSR